MHVRKIFECPYFIILQDNGNGTYYMLVSFIILGVAMISVFAF